VSGNTLIGPFEKIGEFLSHLSCFFVALSENTLIKDKKF